jgi:nicotinamide riboside transporter PnuC
MDTRSQIKTFIAILIAGMGMLGLLQIWFMSTYIDIAIVFTIIFVPIYAVWLSVGAKFVTNKIIEANKNNKK